MISTTKLAKLGVGAAGDKALGFSLDNNKKAQEKADNELRAHKQKLKSQLTDEVMSGAMSMRTADMSTKLSGLSKKCPVCLMNSVQLSKNETNLPMKSKAKMNSFI